MFSASVFVSLVEPANGIGSFKSTTAAQQTKLWKIPI
jgi:hypothetical protein